MLRKMTCAQRAGWLAYAQLEPVGDPVAIETEADKVANTRNQRQEFEAGMKALIKRKEPHG